MSAPKHSRGPWRAAIWQHTGMPDTVCVKDADGQEIIGWPGFDGVPGTKQQIRANARLAAAAPELLAHLEFAVKLLGGFPAINATAQVDAMRAVIAKARRA